MQTKLTEILLSHDISQDIIDDILSNFTENYILEDEAQALFSKEKQDLIINQEINSLLKEFKAKNVTACKALIDFSTISFENEEILGLKEQIEKIKSENPFLFEDEPEYAPKGNQNSLTNYDDLSDDEYFNFLKYKGE